MENLKHTSSDAERIEEQRTNELKVSRKESDTELIAGGARFDFERSRKESTEMYESSHKEFTITDEQHKKLENEMKVDLLKKRMGLKGSPEAEQINLLMKSRVQEPQMSHEEERDTMTYLTLNESFRKENTPEILKNIAFWSDMNAGHVVGLILDDAEILEKIGTLRHHKFLRHDRTRDMNHLDEQIDNERRDTEETEAKISLILKETFPFLTESQQLILQRISKQSGYTAGSAKKRMLSLLHIEDDMAA